MRHSSDKEESFYDRKHAYRSQLDKPIGPSMMITVLPSVIMCVFIVLAAPYIKQIVEKFVVAGDEQVVRKIELAEEKQIVEAEGPPPSADAVILEITRRRLKERGFEEQTKELIEVPRLEAVRPKLDIKPLPMILPDPKVVVTSETLQN